MKMKQYIPAVLLMGAVFTACQDNMEDFDNSVYAPSVDTSSTINVKPGMETATGYVEGRLSKEADGDVTVTFAANPAKVADYNAYYTQNCLELPSKYYKIPEASVVIPAGGNSTGKVAVDFVNLTELDITKTYVLPVSMESTVGSLSNNTYYFVLKEASLVSVVANMKENYGVYVAGEQAPLMSGITQITVEALLYPRDFPNMLATVMGIEGGFLVRIGDAGIPANQLQLATPNGTLTDAAWQFDTNKWTFVSLTYDTATGECKVYFDGIQKGATQVGAFHDPINWNTASGDITDGPRGFYVGYAYDANRYFDGEMSELRVWNRILTKEEINEPYHFYTVDNNASGLVAYWKMDEGSGNLIHDYANGYDLKCQKAPEWIPVSLPVK